MKFVRYVDASLVLARSFDLGGRILRLVTVLYVVCSDIANDTTGGWISKALGDFGTRAQESVFAKQP